MEPLTDILNRVNAELAQLPDKSYLLITPKSLDIPTKENILQQLNYQVQFAVGPKHVTSKCLVSILREICPEPPEIIDDAPNIIEIKAAAEAEQRWPQICKLFKADGYYTRWSLNDLVYDVAVIAEMEHRKFTETDIDPIDVKILVNHYDTVEKFLKHI